MYPSKTLLFLLFGGAALSVPLAQSGTTELQRRGGESTGQANGQNSGQESSNALGHKAGQSRVDFADGLKGDARQKQRETAQAKFEFHTADRDNAFGDSKPGTEEVQKKKEEMWEKAKETHDAAERAAAYEKQNLHHGWDTK